MSLQISKKECEQWKKNKTVNPLTGRKIKQDGAVYKKLKKGCEKKSGKKSSSKKSTVDCDKWKQDWKNGIMLNPETKRKIKEGGPTYKKLVALCGSPSQVQPVAQPVSVPQRIPSFTFNTDNSYDRMIMAGVKKQMELNLNKIARMIELGEGRELPEIIQIENELDDLLKKPITKDINKHLENIIQKIKLVYSKTNRVDKEELEVRNEIKQLLMKVSHMPIIHSAIHVVKKAKSLHELKQIRDLLKEYNVQNQYANEIEKLLPNVKDEQIVNLVVSIVNEATRASQYEKINEKLNELLKYGNNNRIFNELLNMKVSILVEEIEATIIEIEHEPTFKKVIEFVNKTSNYGYLEQMRNELKSYLRAIQNAPDLNKVNKLKKELYEDVVELFELLKFKVDESILIKGDIEEMAKKLGDKSIFKLVNVILQDNNSIPLLTDLRNKLKKYTSYVANAETLEDEHEILNELYEILHDMK